MKKTYLLILLLITLAFLTACAKQAPAPQDIPEDVPPEPQAPGSTQIETENIPTVPAENPNEKTNFLTPIPNVGNAVVNSAENSITITFENQKGTIITLPLTGEVSKYSDSECKNPLVTATYKGNPVVALETQIQNGDEFTVTWDCERLQELPRTGSRFSADLSFSYKVPENGMVYKAMGSVIGSYS